MKDKKGFTLIELLAVIVILGVIMVIAIPQVSSYVQQSREKSMKTEAQTYMNALRNYCASNNEFPFKNSERSYYLSEVLNMGVDEKDTKSPYGNEWDLQKSIVTVHVDDEYHDTYWITLVDTEGYCFEEITEKELETAKVKKCNLSEMAVPTPDVVATAEPEITPLPEVTPTPTITPTPTSTPEVVTTYRISKGASVSEAFIVVDEFGNVLNADTVPAGTNIKIEVSGKTVLYYVIKKEGSSVGTKKLAGSYYKVSADCTITDIFTTDEGTTPSTGTVTPTPGAVIDDPKPTTSMS